MLINATTAVTNTAGIQAALQVLTSLHLTSYLFPDQSPVCDGATFDYIIVGAGTTGCAIANRLSENKNKTVLLIEAGGDPQLQSDLTSTLVYLKGNDDSWKFTTVDDGTKKCHKPTNDDMALGKDLGGTSSSSYIVYNSGNHYDYDDWARIVNDTTWKWENVLPYFKKSQHLDDPEIINSPNGQFYGTNGKVGLTVERSEMRNIYLKAFNQTGNEIVNSINGNNSLGYTDAMLTISNGIRQSSAIAYLVETKNRSNLFVLKHTTVIKIIFDACKNAIGVEMYTYDKRYIIVKSRIEVILCAGVVNSPKLLMLSGIGPRKHLRRHNICTISNLPVGQNLQTHLAVSVIFNMTKLIVPYKPWDPHKFPATVIVGYVSLNKSSGRPAYQTINYANYPSYLQNYCTFTYSLPDEICNNMLATNVNTHMIYSTVNKQTYKSRGQILLRSNNYRDDPYIYPNYYSEKEDLDDTAIIMEDFIKILDTEQFKKVGGVFQDPKLKRCKGLKLFSREYWKCYIKCIVNSQHHYAGTCAMGSVVDSRLRVYGVKRLRVADASIMPHPTTGGTLGSAIMIGEKVSDMIKEDNKDFKSFCC